MVESIKKPGITRPQNLMKSEESTMKKLLAILLVLTMIVALGATSASAASGSVYWLNFKPELDEAAQALAAKYTEQTGVPVKVVTAASGSYQQTLTSERDTSSAHTVFPIGNQAGDKA